jgi:hypothetical protein
VVLLPVLQSSVHSAAPIAWQDKLFGSEERPADRETVKAGSDGRGAGRSGKYRSERTKANRKERKTKGKKTHRNE